MGVSELQLYPQEQPVGLLLLLLLLLRLNHILSDLFLMLAHLSGTICLKHSATVILPPLSKPPSRRTCLIIISKQFFTALPIPSSDAVCVCVCVCACVCG